MPDRQTNIAILHCDIVEFSRLTAQDEQATFQAVQNGFAAARSLVADHRGALINTAGDSLLAVFDTPDAAARTAVGLQQYLAFAAQPLPEMRRVRARIGIHRGDALIADDQAFGNDVNIAARLQELAPAGGICISHDVYLALDRDMRTRCVPIGQKLLRNMDRLVDAHFLRTGYEFEKMEGAQTQTIRPCVLVLPFLAPGGDSALRELGESLTVDVISGLSKFRQLIVLAPHTALSTEGTETGRLALAKQMGEGFVVDASFRTQDQQLRLMVQLLEMPNGRHAWSTRFDLPTGHLNALPAEITQWIVGALAINIDHAVVRPGPDMPSQRSYEQILRARRYLYRMRDRSDSESARAIFQNVLRTEGETAVAHSGLALSHLIDFLMGWSDDDRRAAIEQAVEEAMAAMELDALDSEAQAVFGITSIWQRNYVLALRHLDQAIALNPSHADALAGRGLALVFCGRAHEAISQFEEALRYNPMAPAWYLWGLAISCYNDGQYRNAIGILQRIPRLNRFHRRLMAASFAQLNDQGAASRERDLAMQETPGYTIDHSRQSQPYQNPKDLAPFIEGLAKAGFPDAGSDLSKRAPGDQRPKSEER